MKLDYETLINSDLVERVNFYPYENPVDSILMAACEVYFVNSERPVTYFDIDAQRIYDHYGDKEYKVIWPKKIAWS